MSEQTRMEKWLGVDNIYTTGGIREVHHIEQALKAQTLFERDRDYVVKEGEIIIVDDITGRINVNAGQIVIIAEIERQRIAAGSIRDIYAPLTIVPYPIACNRAQTVTSAIRPVHADALVDVTINVILTYHIEIRTIPLPNTNALTVMVYLVPLDRAVVHLAEPHTETAIAVALIVNYV